MPSVLGYPCRYVGRGPQVSPGASVHVFSERLVDSEQGLSGLDPVSLYCVTQLGILLKHDALSPVQSRPEKPLRELVPRSAGIRLRSSGQALPGVGLYEINHLLSYRRAAVLGLVEQLKPPVVGALTASIVPLLAVLEVNVSSLAPSASGHGHRLAQLRQLPEYLVLTLEEATVNGLKLRLK